MGSHFDPDEKFFRATVPPWLFGSGFAQPLAILDQQLTHALRGPSRDLGDGSARLAQVRRVELRGERDRAVDRGFGHAGLREPGTVVRLAVGDELDALAADLARERDELARPDCVRPCDVVRLVL